MPRTKIPKNSKRNREAANREEKIRTYELKMDSLQMSIDDWEQKCMAIVDNELKMIESRLQTELREMKMSDFLDILTELAHFTDFKASDQTQLLSSQSMCSNNNTTGNAIASANVIACGSNRNDEGYLTEDSSHSTSALTGSGSTLAAFTGSIARSNKVMRTPGPLHSARARRARRSRSACGELNVLGSAKPQSNISQTTAEHGSRSRLRTPLASRPKAISADRTPLLNKKRSSSPSTPPMAFLRWPKPGEIALSKFGSPIVSQVLPDTFANVNIPIRNGVLSLRPKKLEEIQPELLESLDQNTLHQIRTLHENLQLIVKTANKAGLK